MYHAIRFEATMNIKGIVAERKIFFYAVVERSAGSLLKTIPFPVKELLYIGRLAVI